MNRIAADLNLRTSFPTVSVGIFRWLGNLFGRYALHGKVRGKLIDIHTTRFPGCKQFPLRLVVKLGVQTGHNTTNITIRARPFLASIHRIFDGNVLSTGDALLDSKLLISSNNGPLAAAILRYEEIRDQLCDTFARKRHGGILIISNGAIIYHEPFRLIGETTRKRIGGVANLVCDIADVINFESSKLNFSRA